MTRDRESNLNFEFDRWDNVDVELVMDARIQRFQGARRHVDVSGFWGDDVRRDVDIGRKGGYLKICGGPWHKERRRELRKDVSSFSYTCRTG